MYLYLQVINHKENCSLMYSNMEILQKCSRVITTQWMRHKNSNESLKEKAKCEELKKS